MITPGAKYAFDAAVWQTGMSDIKSKNMKKKEVWMMCQR